MVKPPVMHALLSFIRVSEEQKYVFEWRGDQFSSSHAAKAMQHVCKDAVPKGNGGWAYGAPAFDAGGALYKCAAKRRIYCRFRSDSIPLCIPYDFQVENLEDIPPISDLTEAKRLAVQTGARKRSSRRNKTLGSLTNQELDFVCGDIFARIICRLGCRSSTITGIQRKDLEDHEVMDSAFYTTLVADQ
ncbi:unnamed protein product [Clavelina lepadiformis]|uniref:Uncharacterized protein n=1 Tax=Clavelina lepadiformis TaxID=159417 RepID=A0ABP0FZV2_CLALP